MTKFCFIVALVLAVMSCNKAKNVTVGIHLTGGSADVNPVLVTGDSIYEITLDSTGSALLAIAETAKPGYGTFRYGRLRVPVYIADQSFDLSLTLEPRKATPEFTGEGAKVNSYLNDKIFRSFQPDFKADEQAFVASIDDQLKMLYANLDTLGFDPAFVQLEKQRLKYKLYGVLPIYPSYHGYYAKIENFEVSPAFYDRLKSLIVEDESLFAMDEYKGAISSFVEAYSTKDIKERNPLEFVKAQIGYVDQNMTNPTIVSYLINKFAMAYVERNGVEHLAEISPIYNAKVTCPESKAEFEALCGKWAAIVKGQPSPSFKYMNIDGKEVSLEDLAGKYVYIDVWATWCGPCKGELPALKELEHKYKNKNISFVSISCDQDKAAWEKVVKEEKLGGIQLHNGGDRSFMSAYMISGIPRFILLDKEGKIVNANMSRPSNSQTVLTFDALEGI